MKNEYTVDANGKWKLYNASIPEGYEVLGTVTKNGFDIGVLAIVKGFYVKLNENCQITLPQSIIKKLLKSNIN